MEEKDITALQPSDEFAEAKKNTSVIRRISDDGKINVENLTPAEYEKYSRLNASLKLNDINSVSSFGAELHSAMSKYSGEFLKNVRTQKAGELGKLIDSLLGELQEIDIRDFDEPSTFKKIVRKIPVVRGIVKTAEKTMRRYDSIAKNVDDIAGKIQAMKLLALRDNNELQELFNNNIGYGNSIEEYIIAGKIKLNEIEEKLKEMTLNPDKYLAHEIQDVQAFKNTLERKVNDLITIRYVIKQTLVQIRTVQYNNLSISDKAESLITTTLPLWKNQFPIAVALMNQKNAIEITKKISDTTNRILLENADLLKANSVKVARENERSVVDLETLRKTTSRLMETLQEVKNIQEEASKARRDTEKEIEKIESELESSMTRMIKR